MCLGFFLPCKVVVLIHGRYYGGLLTTELLTEIGLAYPDDVTKVTVSFLFLITFGKVLIYLSDIFFQGSPFDTGTANAIK